MACPPSRGSCLHLSPFVLHCALACFPSFFGWCVGLQEGLVSPFVSLASLLASLCWMMCPPSRGFCLLWVPLFSLLVSLCWIVFPPSRGFCLPLSPIFSLLVFPLLDSVSAFWKVLTPTMVSLLAFLCWMVYLSSRGSCLPLSHIVLLPFVGCCLRLPEGLVSVCFLLSSTVPLPVSLCGMVCPPS